ncbi:Hsp20/alpha crystallin family protein [Carboxylicivirga caseinilyticus]|uniref:Hsp20/alpha crystallin family protein n=1 Tax=Carboxylicivirga caseinilyticus TaxID=3417572 RepID=UPI003D34E4C3|nr:Hsp20/alpha crystallin family protein [Marinilabiliaceae bacterium A049]
MKTLVMYNNPFIESCLFEPFSLLTNPVMESTNHTPFQYQWQFPLSDFSKRDLNIEVENNVLAIKGYKKHSSLFNKKESIKEFNSHISLTDDMDVEKINAKFKRGILTIEIPKKKESITYREIPISGVNIVKTKDEIQDNKTGWLDVLTEKIKKTFNHAA